MARRGNVFITIVGILAVLAILAIFFMNTTVQEKHQTERSHISTQAQCLAEAGLERALGIIQQQLNDSEKFKDVNHIAAWIRAPMKAKGAGVFESGIGKDAELDPEGLSQKLILKKEDLEGPNGDELTKLVGFMTGDNSDFEIEVSIELDKAYSIAAEDDYQVPGVQIPWNCHSGVKEFFTNQGFVALTLAIPESLKWLQFELNFGVGGLTIFSVEIVSVLTDFAKWCNFTAMENLLKWTAVHKLLSEVLPDSIYPYEIKLDKNIFPSLADKSGLSLPSELQADRHTEKYGMFNIESKATIIFPTQERVTKTIFATKEFKCADVEPVAPMYSFFVANMHDERLVFNDIGGELSVNNFANYSVITGNPTETEKREFPGLVRVNGTNPMEVNVAFIGNPAGPMDYPKDSGLLRAARGAEWLMMLDNNIKAVYAKGDKYTQVSNKQIAYVEPKTPVSDSAKGEAPVGGSNPSTTTGSSDPVTSESAAPATENPKSFMSAGKDAVSNFVKSAFSGVLKVNVTPNTTKFGLSMFQLPLHFLGSDVLGGSIGPFKIKDPMSKWEWPMAGVGFRYYRVPFPTPSRTVTHLFGDSSLFPTLTREIEGYVLKAYRQWHFCMMSYPPGPIPLGNQILTPWGFMILPIPFPLWHTHDISDKYGFNLAILKSPKNDSGEVDTNTNSYNPAFMENAPPNLYSPEQYAKKAVYYYPTAQDFYDDIPNRLKDENGKKCLNLNGITYIADSITLPAPGVAEMAGDTFYVTGRGGIVVGGNIKLEGHVKDAYTGEEERAAGTPRTVFSLICRKGGLLIESGPENIEFEGSLYTDKGIAINGGRSILIMGNWITNKFSKAPAQGDIRIEYTAYKTRSSMTSLNPTYGVYDPERYIVSLAPGYASIRAQ
ncbi:MAG: hypothetical protein KKB51_18545 [Candidatus Riflebacteria bacterium]|nr:hypothetical protein [Candidatus Riflebacteria bacterium]